MGPCIVNVFFQEYQKDATLYNIFITVNALHVSGGLSAHHQELKNCTHSIWYMSSLLAATARVGELELTHASQVPT
jgi:hypothetical protein